jgi:probable FeS assembly SUF system protein SufT
METRLLRDCSATIIPEGTAMTLEKDTPAFVTQTLGGNVTVRIGQSLYRISSADVDALDGVDVGDAATAPIHRTSEAFSEDMVWEALKQCFDPEIPVNIVDLGLIYDMRLEDLENGKKDVAIKMTLTAQGCGMGPVIAQDAKNRVEQLDEVENADVQIVWEPVWNPQMISDTGRKALGIE